MSSSIDPTVGTGPGATAPAPGATPSAATPSAATPSAVLPSAATPSAVLLDREPARLATLTPALERAGIVTVAAETTFAAASAAIARHAPTVVLLDAGLHEGETSSLELVAELRQSNAALKLIWLAEPEDRTPLGRVFAAGADAMFLRSSSPLELARAVSRLLRDDSLFVPVPGWTPSETRVGAGSGSRPARRTTLRLAKAPASGWTDRDLLPCPSP